MRLDKYLSEMGADSRSVIRDNCKKKRVLVNGTPATKSDTQVTPGQDVIIYCGREITYAANEYYMLHKPRGVVTAVTDSREKTVLDLIGGQKRKDLFPVGRLDKDTEGLLLITNDGPLCQKLLSPKHHVDKTYYARVDGIMKPEYVEMFQQGLDIGDEKKTLPAVLEILSSGETSEIRLTITEGRFHQVKRMCQAVGCQVTYLKRLTMGSLNLDESLKPGEYRKLTEEEIRTLGVNR